MRYYCKLTNETIRKMKDAWFNFINTLISDIKTKYEKCKREVEEEAQDDYRNERYTISSIYDWEQDNLNDLWKWRTEQIDEMINMKEEGNKLIGILSDFKLYKDQDQCACVFSFYKMDHYKDFEVPLCIRIEGLSVNYFDDDSRFEREFSFDDIEYTDWVLEN